MKKLIASKKQFLLYCVIGFSGTLVDFATFSLLVRFGGLGYQAANAVGYASGTLLSFVLNARYNFRITDRIALRMLSFFGVAFLGWLMSAGLLHLMVEKYRMDKYVAKLITLAAVVLLQYNLNRLLSFRKPSSPK